MNELFKQLNDLIQIALGLGAGSLVWPSWQYLLAHTKNARIKAVEVWASQYVREEARLLGEGQGELKKQQAVSLLADRIKKNGWGRFFTDPEISHFVESAYGLYKAEQAKLESGAK